MWIDASEEKPDFLTSVQIAYTDDNGKNQVTIGWYAPRFTIESSSFDGEVDDEYDENEDEYYIKEGWYDESVESEYHYPIQNVTHWQDKPKHPNSSKA